MSEQNQFKLIEDKPKQIDYFAPTNNNTSKYTIQQAKSTIVVTFRYKSENVPEITTDKILYYLKPIIQEFPLQCPPRIYGSHKFYLQFTQQCPKQLPKRIQYILMHKYRKCSIKAAIDTISQQDRCTVYLGCLRNVTQKMLEDKLNELQIKYNQVRLAMDKQTHKSKNFAYVECVDEQERDKLIQQMNGIKLGGSDGIKAVKYVED